MLNINFAAAFEPFYTDTVEVLKITETGVYNKTRTETSLGQVPVDLQPYSGELMEKEYGLKKDCQLRLFCINGGGISDMLTEGNYIRVTDSNTGLKGKLYRIEYAPEWRMGGEAVLKEVESLD